MTQSDADYERLAAFLTDPNTPLPEPVEIYTGAEAAAHGRAMMIREYGSEDALEAALDEAMRRPGRVPAGETAKGSSPTVRGRIPEREFAAFKRLEAETGRTQSELVREAVHNLLVAHHALGGELAS